MNYSTPAIESIEAIRDEWEAGRRYWTANIGKGISWPADCSVAFRDGFQSRMFGFDMKPCAFKVGDKVTHKGFNDSSGKREAAIEGLTVIEVRPIYSSCPHIRIKAVGDNGMKCVEAAQRFFVKAK